MRKRRGVPAFAVLRRGKPLPAALQNLAELAAGIPKSGCSFIWTTPGISSNALMASGRVIPHGDKKGGGLILSHMKTKQKLELLLNGPFTAAKGWPV